MTCVLFVKVSLLLHLNACEKERQILVSVEPLSWSETAGNLSQSCLPMLHKHNVSRLRPKML